MSVQPSPAVKRAGRVLKLIATEPSGELTLSELARRLGAHRSSCHTILLALSEEGLVKRHATKGGPTYRLGPAVVELAAATSSNRDALERVDAALLQLRDRFGASALAGQVVGDAIVVLRAHPVVHPYGYTVTTGTSVPFRAPVGTVYAAWATGAVIEAWLARAEPSLSRRRRAEVLSELAVVRARGWSATVRPQNDGRRRPAREADAADVQRQRLSVIGVSAPVWDGQAQLVCSLALAAFSTDLTGRELQRVAKTLKAEADALTNALSGRLGSSMRRGERP
jgi:DNA-binding IclR family transcriptional regulator